MAAMASYGIHEFMVQVFIGSIHWLQRILRTPLIILPPWDSWTVGPFIRPLICGTITGILDPPWTLGHLDTWTLGHLDAWTLERFDTWTLGRRQQTVNQDWTLGHLDTWTLGHLDTWTLGHLNPWTLENLHSWTLDRLDQLTL